MGRFLAALLLVVLLPPAQGNDTIAIEPITMDLPAWLDTDALARLRAGNPVAVPVGAAVPPLGMTIAPGSWLLFPNWCTLNFVFREASTGAIGIGTAGHCIAPGQRAEVVMVDARPGGRLLATLRPIGIATRVWAGGIGHDFALIEVFPDLVPLVDPAIRGARGPCGAYDGILATGPSTWVPGTPFPITQGGLPLVHVGHGLAVGTGGTIRIATGAEPRPEHVQTSHIAVNGLVGAGDSGSPVRLAAATPGATSRLAAVGILTHALVFEDVPAGHAFGTSMPEILRLVAPWRLVDDPACPLVVDAPATVASP